MKPSRTKSGWDFVVEVGLLSLLCYLVSRLLIFCGTLLWPATWKPWWPNSYPLDLALGLFPVSELVGVTLAKTNRYWAALLSVYHRWVTGHSRNFQFSDVFFATCDELLGADGLVDTELREGRRDDLKVTYTTFYEPTPDTRRAFLVPADQVSTFARFDWNRFDHFVRSGDITIEIPQDSTGEETE